MAITWKNIRATHGKTIFGLSPGSEIANLFYKCLKEKKSIECIVKVEPAKWR